jgi:hypothetical protein
MTVGMRVLILTGMWTGKEGKIIEVIHSDHTDDRYDVDCAPGRWFYPYEMSAIVEAA